MKTRAASALLLCAGLAGCSGYTPRPLPDAVRWRDTASLRVDVRRIGLPVLAAQRFTPGARWTMQQVAALAVLNDPRLRAARDRAGVARAQAFAAGLLPDPRLSASRDIPQGRQPGADTTGYRLGLRIDLGSLFTHGAALDAARQHLREVDLRVLWQEWQTAAAAQADYVELVGLRERDALLHELLDAAALRLRRERAAQAARLVPRTRADVALADTQALGQQLDADARRRADALAALDALLGLRPATELALAGLPAPDPGAFEAAEHDLRRLGSIRPDLRALRAGYASQESRLREAVLAQFPAVSVGLSRARDTSDVNTLGFGVQLRLPLFDGARGDIAVQRATRQALHDEYALRLRRAQAQAAQLLARIGLLREQRERLRAALPALADGARAADAALRRGDATLAQAQAAQRAWIGQRLALQVNAQAAAQQSVALQLLTGSGVFAPAR